MRSRVQTYILKRYSRKFLKLSLDHSVGLISQHIQHQSFLLVFIVTSWPWPLPKIFPLFIFLKQWPMSVWIHHLGINQSINWLFIYVLSYLIKEWTQAGFISSHKFHVDLTILSFFFYSLNVILSMVRVRVGVSHQVSCASTMLSRHIWTSAWNVTNYWHFC